MGKVAFVFPGQGSQTVGMGRNLASSYASAGAVFAEADSVLGFSLSRLCFEGPAEELTLTENTQPAILTVSTAAATVLRENGYQPDYVAGHSLGEFSALVAAGALRFADALRLVRLRGRFMQEAVPVGVGAMAALLKLPAGILTRIVEEAGQGEVLSPANLNSPDQVVVAGHAGAVKRSIEMAKAAGARKALLLPVSAPFHCPLMAPAQDRLKAELDATEFRNLSIPLVNNWQAQLVNTAEEARAGLFHQVPNPVRWEETIRLLASLGVTKFIEAGPGTVLTGLLRSIDPALEGLNSDKVLVKVA
jgi:[acyl-carrier-protein] S-malonyltransferase